ncbi:hypothetical protein [Olivibacter sp. XZL3]|uniref:hypothetical protein n=1 Tax=Olivibacter sp. XZL3 TaxID=1735116 RepID=UPI0010655D21|nr:hypothetical protein [Olivibacter sp. XZL3]
MKILCLLFSRSLLLLIVWILGIGYTKAQLYLSPEQSCRTTFIWRGDTINGQWEPYAAMLVPVGLNSYPKQLYMQFDLGAQASLFYHEPLQAIAERYPAALQKVDSTLYVFNLGINTTTISAKNIAIENGGEANGDIIGTIGVDFIKNHLIVIDYPQQVLHIGNTLAQHYAAPDNWTDFEFLGNRILLPGIIQEKQRLLYFDSGSSSFELITNKESCKQLAQPQTQPQVYTVQSWYGSLTAHTYPTDEEISIAGKSLAIERVTYMDGANKEMQAIEAQLQHIGIEGMIGNKLFLNYRLWINMQDKKFALTQ